MPLTETYAPNYVHLVVDVCKEFKKPKVKKMMKKYSNIPPSCPVLSQDKYEFRDFVIDPEVLPPEMPMKHMMVKSNVTGTKGEIVSTSVKHSCELIIYQK